MSNMKERYYTVKEVAERKAITVKTLHHYDKIGLLKPDKLSKADHRLYSRANLGRLDAILYFREIGVPLKDIASLLQDTTDKTSTLKKQLFLLNERHRDLGKQIEGAMNAIAILETPAPYVPEACDQHDDMCLFADREILKGELVYSRVTPRLIFDIEQEQYDTLNLKRATKEYVLENSFWDELEEELHIDCDALPFIRHSDKPNLIQDRNHNDIYLIAIKDIKSGSEITR